MKESCDLNESSNHQVWLQNSGIQMEPFSAERNADFESITGILKRRTNLDPVPNLQDDGDNDVKEPTISSDILASSNKSMNHKLGAKTVEEKERRRDRKFSYKNYQWSNPQQNNSPLPIDFGQKSSFKNIDLDDIPVPLIVQSSDKEFNSPRRQYPTGSDGMSSIWRLRGLPIIHFISKFVSQLKTRTDKIKFRLITYKVFQIIGDFSSDYDTIVTSRQNYVQPTYRQQIRKQVITVERWFVGILQTFQETSSIYFTVLQPDSGFKMVWDFIVVFLIVLNIFYIPMKLSFEIDKKDSRATTLLLETFPSYVFIFEILLKFNTAYYHKGIIHTNRKQIFKHYVTGQFFWDVIVVIPFIISQFRVPYTDFTLLLRVTRVRSMVSQLEEALNLREQIQAIFDVLKLVYFLIFVAHFTACAWNYIAVVEYQYWNAKTTWIIEANLQDAPWTQRYISSIYWSTITILTVGYGDIKPTTDYERVFVVFVALIICGAFGYSVSQIGSILQRLEEKQAVFRIKLKSINHHIQKRGLSKALQLKVRKYFEYYFKLEEEENQNAEALMSNLTKRLKEEVLIDIYRKILTESRFLGNNFSQQLLNQLCLLIREKKFAPEEEIFSKGEVSSKLIFILRGEIQIYAEGDSQGEETIETTFRTYKSGYVIGEKEFATNRMYEFNARAIKFTQVALLDFDEFYKCLKDYPEDFERFCLMRDNLIFNENYKSLGKVCEICQSSHSFIRCPFVFYQANYAKILTTFRSTKVQKRQYLQRNRKRQKAITRLSEFQEAALGLIIRSNIIPEEDLSDDYLNLLGFKLTDEVVGSDQLERSAHYNQSLVAMNSNNRINPRSDSQVSRQSKNDKQSEFKIGGQQDTCFFGKEMNSELDRLEWDQGSMIKNKKNSKLVVKGLKNSMVENSQYDEIDDDHSALQLQQMHMKRVQFRMPQVGLRVQTSTQNTARPSQYFERQSEKKLSMRSSRALVSMPPNLGTRTYSRQFSRQYSKQSDASCIYDRRDNQSRTNASMQVIENKRFDRDERSRKLVKKKSIITSILDNNFLVRKQSITSNRSKSKSPSQVNNSITPHHRKSDEFVKDTIMEQVKSKSDRHLKLEDHTQNIEDNPAIPMEFKLILHEHTDMDIDRCYSSQIYFPIFNPQNVVLKINQQLNVKRENNNRRRSRLTRTRTINPFDRIQSTALKTSK